MTPKRIYIYKRVLCSDGSMAQNLAKKMKKMGMQVIEFPKTTVRIYQLDIVKLYVLSNGETFNRYVNRLIESDILANGDEEIVTKYFKKGT